MRYVGIDPSTKTGFVALSGAGEVLRAKELTGIGDKDPKRITTLVQEVVQHIKPGDVIGIEGFSYNSQGRGIGFQFGLGYAIRIAMYSRNHSYTEITPGQLKKFATGSGNTAKAEMPGPIAENWGYSHPSDNVLDAYVLARIMFSIRNREQLTFSLTDYQKEVIDMIINPAAAKKPKAKRKAKRGDKR
ncbi:hypothetical protein [Halalkalibacter oceani]|uniref:hypothetical protein n=1 Tax=Halalkalibacter oceani TaxID=1653776 RepID=UPI003392EC4A